MSNLTQIHILVVDDEPDILTLLTLILKTQQIQISTALGGEIGLDKAISEKPDIVITDLMMPTINGFAVMEGILKSAPETTVIMVTAYASMEAVVKALRLGAFDFINKPFNKDLITATITKAIQNKIAYRTKVWQQDIIATLSFLRNPLDIAHKFLAQTATALGCHYGFIWRADKSQSPLLFNLKDADIVSSLKNWIDQVGLIDTHKIQENIIKYDNSAVLDNFSGSVMGASLTRSKALNGVLILAHEQSEFFSQDDVTFLKALIPFAVLALDNARLYENLVLNNQRLTTIQSINALAYNAKLSLDRLLRLAVEGVRQNMGYPGIIICLPDNENTHLSIRAAAGKLDQNLIRRGDTPTRKINFLIDDFQNPFSLVYASKQATETSVQSWIEAFNKAQAPDMGRALHRLQVTQTIILPLWQVDEVIGILGVAHSSPELISIEEKTMLSTIANQVALIINNATLYQAEQQGRREMEALYHAGLSITSTLSHQDVLRTIIQQMVDLTNVDSCIIGRLDTVSDTEVIELYLQKKGDVWREMKTAGTQYPLQQRPLVKKAMDNGTLEIVASNDIAIHNSERLWMQNNRIALRLIIPLIIRDKSIGVIELLTGDSSQHFSQHIIRIAQGLAAQAAIALENARLHELETKRVEQEMDLAQRIQRSLLPHETPVLPNLSIAAQSVSARLVGGDFYRYLPLPDGKFGVAIGDVSGKGVPSAIFMAIVTTAIDGQVLTENSPGGMLQKLNQILCPRMQANKMNTGLVMAVFDDTKQELHLANAGMIFPLMLYPDSEQGFRAEWIEAIGLPLGITEEANYYTVAVPLVKNSVVIFLSDGLIEAQNQDNVILGFSPFEAILQELPAQANSSEILDKIWTKVDEFVGPAEQHDDMTMVVIQVQ